MSYTDLAASLLRAKERSGARVADEPYLTELLNLSAGLKPPDAIVTYRPFFVAAKWLEQDRVNQQISEADGAKFTGLAKPIASLMALQHSIDVALGLVIPVGFEAVTDTSVATSSGSVTRYGTRSVRTVARP